MIDPGSMLLLLSFAVVAARSPLLAFGVVAAIILTT